jgi:hypothetical protein
MRYMMFVCVDPAAETYAPEEDNIDEWVGEMDRRKVRILGNRLTGWTPPRPFAGAVARCW